MQIKLDHVGIIKDSTLVLDGLTVITGKNSSGKTTVGKTLYAILDATRNLRGKARTDREAYIKKRLDIVRDLLVGAGRYVDEGETLTHMDMEETPEALRGLVDNTFVEKYEKKLEAYAHRLAQELKSAGHPPAWFAAPDYLLEEYRQKSFDGEAWEKARGEALVILNRLFEDLDKDPALMDYARESINQALRVEFNGQIQPVRAPDVTSTVELTENGADTPAYFRFSIVNNNVVNDGAPVFFRAPLKRAYMIDNPFVLDAPPVRSRLQGYGKKEASPLFNFIHAQPHNRRLWQALINARPVNIFEQTLLNESLRSVKEQIDHTLPGAFEFSPDGEYYVENNAKVRVSNLAAGSKMFSIIKLLLEHGRIDAGTMLILDEPEAHLHPAWQNAFAEIIVLLVKELRVNVVLTTHSPNFMLALDAHMRKHRINERTNFYQTDILEDGFVRHRCVNDDLGQIYDDFLRYLSEMQRLRNQYLHGEGESM